MKVPVSWLKEYVDFEDSIESLADKLTFSGTQVEEISVIGGDFVGIVAAEVIAVEDHPNADTLKICKVNNGSEEVSVVCGANNFKVGDKVPFIGVGSKLPDGTKIRKAKLRGVESFGMLCAEDELGLSDNHDGLMLLPEDTVVGTGLAEILGPPDVVLDLEVTWNRSDCLSVIGVAREVAAIYGTTLKIPDVDLKEQGTPVAEMVDVDVKDSDGCPRYTARILSDVKLAPSPLWMQRRLSMCGVRPICNIVDVTNYVMLECGHPLHAFDYTLLDGQKIEVRRARNGEKLATLDGLDRDITSDMLVIADATRPVAVAGVMGGAGSEINEDTSTVLLESACFNAPDIRKMSSKLGLMTESSHRFERSVNVDTVDWASRRAAGLMAEVAGGVVAPGVVDVYPVQYEAKNVQCNFKRTRDLLGVDVSGDEIVEIFSALELPVVDKNDEYCTVAVPGFRSDLTIEADLVEEVVRIYGLDKISDKVPCAVVVPNADDSRTRSTIAYRRLLAGLGLSEIMHYSFLSERLLNIITESDKNERVIIPYPVSADHSVLRNTLIPQMIETLGRNLSRQTENAAFFEMGRVFVKSSDGSISDSDKICIGIMGNVGQTGPDGNKPVKADELFLNVKGIMEVLLRKAGILNKGIDGVEDNSEIFSLKEEDRFADGVAVSISSAGKEIGVMGLVAERIRKEWRVAGPVAVAEISLNHLIDNVMENIDLKELPQYPAINRDMALIVDESVKHADILRIIEKVATRELTSVRLFDIFRSEGIGVGRKSLAYSLVYRSYERTLTDDDANRYHEAIKSALKEELKIEAREG